MAGENRKQWFLAPRCGQEPVPQPLSGYWHPQFGSGALLCSLWPRVLSKPSDFLSRAFALARIRIALSLRTLPARNHPAQLSLRTLKVIWKVLKSTITLTFVSMMVTEKAFKGFSRSLLRGFEVDLCSDVKNYGL